MIQGEKLSQTEPAVDPDLWNYFYLWHFIVHWDLKQVKITDKNERKTIIFCTIAVGAAQLLVLLHSVSSHNANFDLDMLPMGDFDL